MIMFINQNKASEDTKDNNNGCKLIPKVAIPLIGPKTHTWIWLYTILLPNQQSFSQEIKKRRKPLHPNVLTNYANLIYMSTHLSNYILRYYPVPKISE